MDANGVQTTSVVGHSYGGRVARWMVLLQRERVDRLARGSRRSGPYGELRTRLALFPVHEEQRAIVRGERPVRPAFKCGPEENRRAWEAVTEEFFGGVDLVPGC